MAWLTGELARRKRPLRAGEIALSGVLGTMVPVSPAMLSKRRLLVSVRPLTGHSP
jgi:2-keto-4-pentenoate hydratase